MTSIECRLINACAAAYQIAGGVIPEQPYLSQVGLAAGTQPAVFVDGTRHVNAGYVCQTSDDWVIVVFRGTLPPFSGNFWSWVDDWLQDFKAGPIDWYVNGAKFGRVETGFSDAVLNLWPQAKAAIDAIDLSRKKGILVTGHSKGAAMTFLVASLLKAAYPHMLVEAHAFAAPLVTDRSFVSNYDTLGLDAVTVRYQNADDLVPFLPWWPSFGLLATTERRHGDGTNHVVTAHSFPTAIENDYVAPGSLRFITPSCTLEYGPKAQADAWAALKHALEHFEFEKIVDAHSAAGRYLTCTCQASMQPTV